MTAPDAGWLVEYLKPLVGARVVSVDATVEDREVWPVIVVETESHGRLTLEISRDSEGNGPGFVFGLPRPK